MNAKMKLTKAFGEWAATREGVPAVVNLSPDAYATEQYRNLAVQVDELVSRAARSYALALISPANGDGKTLTALNLALTLAKTGDRRVLLVEGDLWRPTLHRYLDLTSDTPGLFQLLEERVELQQAVIGVRATGLDVLTAGGGGRVGNLVGGRRMAAVMEILKGYYEMVILDCPPLSLASGRSLAVRADGALVIVRAGQTRKKGIEEVLAALGPGKVVGIVLNGARTAKLSY